MKIGIYNLEPKCRNLALDKIRCYYQAKGDTVLNCSPLEAKEFDVVYASSIFDWTPKTYVNGFITGGTGFDLTTKLPPEIEATQPHLNYGHTTRGCFRNCKFCVVVDKEGPLKAVAMIDELWDGKSRLITLLDNNPLGLPDHFESNVIRAIELKLCIDWNQGLDHRLLTPENIDLIKSVSHKELRFAFDHPSYINSVEKAIDLLKKKGINRAMWYVLCGFDTTIEQDLFRLNYLKSRGQRAFVQKYRSKDKKPNKIITGLARWANQHPIFYGYTWQQFIDLPENRCYR